MSKIKTYIKGHKVTHKHIFKMATTTNLFLMNCGECLTLDELRFIISNDLRVVKRDVEADVEADVGTSDRVPEETNEVPVIEEQEQQQQQQQEQQHDYY